MKAHKPVVQRLALQTLLTQTILIFTVNYQEVLLLLNFYMAQQIQLADNQV